jgi:hypothetical protein
MNIQKLIKEEFDKLNSAISNEKITKFISGSKILKPLYHITKMKNVDNILKHGFKPIRSKYIHFAGCPTCGNMRNGNAIITVHVNVKNPAPLKEFDEYTDYLFKKYDPNNERSIKFFNSDEFKKLGIERYNYFIKNNYDCLIYGDSDIWILYPEDILIVNVNKI